MKILLKKGDVLEILCVPDELTFEIGDYLKISQGDNVLLAQVIDVSYPDLPGTVEDILRDLVMEEVGGASILDPYSTGSISMLMRETRLVIAKTRVILEKDRVSQNSPWLPSRYSSIIEKASTDFLEKLTSAGNSALRFHVGTVAGKAFSISVTGLDGSLTIVTGKKESGKSHLAKILLEGIAGFGGTVLVLDINGEYLNLDKTISGERSKLADSIQVLEPGRNFRASLNYMGLKTFLDILEHVYATPSTSLREFARVWRSVERNSPYFSLEDLIDAIEKEEMNEAVREALLSRLQSILSSGFFDEKGATELEKVLASRKNGNVVILNLSRLLPSTRKLVVEYLLSLLSTLLSQNKLEPLFMLAEEAHLYIRETYWEDLVTRMRHIGLFPIFVTNQPDSIPELVYRQADNIFLFNFTNEADLEKLAKVSRIDMDTVKLLVKKMPPRHCLLIGRVVSDIPLMLKVRPSNLQTMGMTKLFFKPGGMNHVRIERQTDAAVTDLWP